MIPVLMIYPYQIVVFLGILMILVMTSIVLASKRETRFHFLIWGAIIVFIPVVGAISYLIKYATDKKKVVNS